MAAILFATRASSRHQKPHFVRISAKWRLVTRLLGLGQNVAVVPAQSLESPDRRHALDYGVSTRSVKNRTLSRQPNEISGLKSKAFAYRGGLLGTRHRNFPAVKRQARSGEPFPLETRLERPEGRVEAAFGPRHAKRVHGDLNRV